MFQILSISGQSTISMIGRTTRDPRQASLASCICKGDPIAGTSLEREGLNSQISSYLETIDAALEQLEKLTASGFDESTADLCEPILDGLSQNTEILRQMFDYEPPRQRSFGDTSQAVVFASMFSNYVRHVTDLLGTSVFAPISTLPYVASFARLHLFYAESIFNNKGKMDVQKFRDVWSHHFLVWSRIRDLIHEIDFASFYQRFAELCDAVSHCVTGERGTDFRHSVVDESLNDIKRKFNMANVEATPTLLKNILTDIQWFKEKVKSYIDLLKDPATSQQLSGKMASVTGKPTMILETCLAAMSLVDFMAELDSLVRSRRFELDPVMFQTSGYQWRAVTQILELASIEARSLGACFGGMVRSPSRAAQMAAASRALALAMSKYEDISSRVFEDRMAPFAEVTCFIDSELEANTMQHFKTKVQQLHHVISDRSRYEMLVTALDHMETEFRMTTTNGTMDGLAERLRLFYKFETLLRESAELSVEDQNVLRTMKRYVCGNMLALKLREIGKIVVSVTTNWSETGSRQHLHTKHFRIVSSIENLSSMVGSLISSRTHTKEASIFIEFFSRFLDVFSLVMSMNSTGEFDDVIHYGLTSFPHLGLMRCALPVEGWLKEIRRNIGDIQNRSMRTTAFVTYEFNLMKNTKDSQLISDTLTESERIHALVLSVLRKIESVRLATKFLFFYESFIKAFAKEPDTPLQVRTSPSVTVQVVEQFPRFTICLMSFLKSGVIKRGLTPMFFKHWMEFVRSIIINEDVERKTSFAKLLESIPFLDFSRILQDALFNLKVIKSKLYFFQRLHKDKDCTKVIRAFSDMHRTFIHVFVMADPLGYGMESKIQKFLKCSLDVSQDLYREIQRLWPTVMLLFSQFSTLVDFHKIICVLKADMKMEPEPGDRVLFGCFFMNSVMCTVSAMTSLLDCGMLPRETAVRVREFRDAVSSLNSARHFQIVKDQEWYATLARQNEQAKQYWRPCLADRVGRRAMPYFLSILSSVASPEIPCPAANFAKMERISELLMEINSDNSDFDKFTLLVEIKSIFDTVHKPAGQERAIAKFTESINLGLMTYYVLSLLVINDLFAGQNRLPKNIDIRPLPVPRETPPTTNREDFISHSITKIPNFVAELEQQIRAVTQNSGLPRDTAESLQNSTSDLVGAIKGYLRSRCPDSGEGLGSLVQANRTLRTVLRTTQEQHEHARVEWLQEEASRQEKLQQQRAELDQLKIETAQCHAELTALTEKLSWTEGANATLEQQIAKLSENGATFRASEEEEEEESGDADVDQEGTEAVTQEQAEAVRHELKQAHEQNAELRKVLRNLEQQLGITQAPNEASGTSRISAWPDINGTTLPEIAEKSEHALMSAVDKFKEAMWHDAGAYRAGCSRLVNEIQRAWSCYQAFRANNSAIQADIDRMQASVTETRSALLRLLQD